MTLGRSWLLFFTIIHFDAGGLKVTVTAETASRSPVSGLRWLCVFRQVIELSRPQFSLLQNWYMHHTYSTGLQQRWNEVMLWVLSVVLTHSKGSVNIGSEGGSLMIFTGSKSRNSLRIIKASGCEHQRFPEDTQWVRKGPSLLELVGRCEEGLEKGP